MSDVWIPGLCRLIPDLLAEERIMAPELIYRGMDRCDACGAQLPPSDQLAGFCEACQATLRPRPARQGKGKAPRQQPRRTRAR